ncbi:MAG: hypothetical protein ACLRUM_01400 [Veillonella parvula]
MWRIKTCSTVVWREGNKDNWLDELAHSEREIASIEDKLATLYERRGQIVEAMRTLGF